MTIPAGQTKTVSIDIDCSDLWYWDTEQNRITFDQGTYTFEVGASSRDIRGSVNAVMKGQLKQTLETVVVESNRMILNPGESAESRLSATLLDDSFVAIENTEVVYKTTNPSVVTVDQNGMITAHVAVFRNCFVTYNGTTASDSYPVVVPDLTPATISVNGIPLQSFNRR